MFCIIAFSILAVMGIFSASNRVLAREAFDCVTRRVTFRPCNTGFDEKMKAKILGVVITRSEGAARFLNRYFEVLAWIFFVLTLASSLFAVRGLYLFYTTGSCNGLNDSGFCVFDPTGANNQVSNTAASCQVSENPLVPHGLTVQGVDLSAWPVLNPDGKKEMVFIGCYACDYTRKVYPEIRKLADQFGVKVIYGEYPTKEKTDYLARVGYCVYKTDQAKYWQLNDALFAQDKALLEDPTATGAILTRLGLDAAAVETCAAAAETETAVKALLKEIRKTNFYGTPTIFIDGTFYVGPKPNRVYAIALEGLFYWLKK
jgi:2-hydroxychromene-2-carboxylate isomerase